MDEMDIEKEEGDEESPELTPEVCDALDVLRKQGFAVVVFTKEELDGADPIRVADRLVELGWEVIEDWK